jgi:hypothetical protein
VPLSVIWLRVGHILNSNAPQAIWDAKNGGFIRPAGKITIHHHISLFSVHILEFLTIHLY